MSNGKDIITLLIAGLIKRSDKRVSTFHHIAVLEKALK